MKIMCKTVILYIISYIFKLFRYIRSDILHRGKGETFPGYILSNLPVNLLQSYFKSFNSSYIFVTGTNGKTSTTSLIKHLLENAGYTVLSNSSGSNLKRGLLSTFALNFSNFIRDNPDYIVLEVDEASVSTVLKDFPKDKFFNLIVLNLSRDQLDRYGEVDILIDKINNTLDKFANYNLIIEDNTFSKKFKPPLTLVKDERTYISTDSKTLAKKIGIEGHLYLEKNLDFVLVLFKLLDIKIENSLVKPFSLVPGRGTSYKYENCLININLTKNPVSFNNNLRTLKKHKAKNVLIYVNDYIPDGRDVSWFYDIDLNLLEESLNSKNVFVAGSRSFDFYNLLKTCNIESFNFLEQSYVFKYVNKWNVKDLFVLSNYSATQSLLKKLQ